MLQKLCLHSTTKRNWSTVSAFLKGLFSIKIFARQGLPLRESVNDSDSNLMQLLKLQSENEPRIATWFEKKTDKYTASDMQNEILKEMTLDILQKVIESLDHKGDSATMVLHPCVVPVANQIQAEEPRAVYTHCYEHSLHLPCSDAVTDCKITWNALDTLYEIIKLVLKSHLVMLLHFSNLRTSCQKTPLVAP